MSVTKEQAQAIADRYERFTRPEPFERQMADLAATIVEQAETIERVRVWAADQAKPFADGVPDREGEAVLQAILLILDGAA